MVRALLSALWNDRPEQVLARDGPSMLFVPAVQLVPGVEYRALIRGYVHRNLSFQSLVKAVVWANATVADRRYVSIRGVEDMLRSIGVRGEITFVPNATDPNRFKPVEELTPPEIESVVEAADYVVGFVGSMKERHLVKLLIDAVSQLSDSVNVALVLVGDGPRRAALEERVAERGLTNQVVFTGHLPIDQVPTYIAACDVMYGLSHVTKPSNPIKIYEYLSCGKPVITTNTDDLGFVNDKRLGVAIDQNTVDSVYNALQKLYNEGKDSREEMGRRGRNHILDNHTWESYIRTMTENDY
jgi:glycosyltransferase involved in cell wall biosynthesis